MKKWIENIRVFWEAVIAIYKARRMGVKGPIVLMMEEDNKEWGEAYQRLERDNRDMQQVVHALIRGESACPWCEERKECLHKEGKLGCAGWWLRWPDDGA